MIKKILFVFYSLLLFTISISAQIEDRRDSISISTEHPLNSFKDMKYSDSLKVESERHHISEVSVEEQKRRDFFIRSLLFILPTPYIGPSPNPTIEEQKNSRILSNSDDYAFYDTNQLEDNLYLQTSSLKTTYLGIGGITSIDANLTYRPTDWLTISGGVYSAKYLMPNSGMGPSGVPFSHFNDFGFSASMRFKLHDYIYLRAHGLYSINSSDNKRNFTPATAGMFPQTYFGAGLEFRATDKFGIEGGMVRELNPFNGKWSNRPYIMPVFHLLGR